MSVENKIKRVANALVRRSYWFNTVAFPDCQKFWRHNTFNVEVVNLGSSSGKHSFDYTGLDIKAANWAMAPQTLVCDLKILENYFSYLAKGAMVIIPLCPFSSLGGGNPYIPDKYYSILNPVSIPSFCIQKRNEVRTLRESPIRAFPLVALVTEVKQCFKGSGNKAHGEEYYVESAKRAIDSWMFEFSIKDLHAPLKLINQDRMMLSAQVLNELVGFCKKKGLKPVLVFPPVSSYLATYFTADVMDRFVYSFISMADVADVPFLNYLDSKDFTSDALFKDAYYLNTEGAKHFTQQVLKELKLI